MPLTPPSGAPLPPEQVIEDITDDRTVVAIFDTAEAIQGFLREVKAVDWGPLGKRVRRDR